MPVVHPEVLWAQRSSESEPAKNVLYATVNLPDIKPETLVCDITPTSIVFKAKAGNAAKGLEEREYEFSLDFFAEISPEESSKILTSRHFALVLRKKEAKAEYWPRLSKAKNRAPQIKTDFSKWVDEDEQDGAAPAVEEEDTGGMPGGMDFESMMKSMGGGGGAGGLGGLGGLGDMGGLGGGSSNFANPDPDPGSDEDDDGPPPLEEPDAKA